MCNNATLQRQNTYTRVPHYKRLEIRVLTNILASVSHSTKFKHPVGPQTEHVGREDQDMKSSRKRQTCWDRDEMREIEREISLSVNTSCTGRLWHISFHFMLSLHVCSTAVEPCNMDYTDISIGHIHTTLAPKTSFGKHARAHAHAPHTQTQTQCYCSFCYCHDMVFKGILNPNLNFVISYSLLCDFKLVCLNFTREHKSRMY